MEVPSRSIWTVAGVPKTRNRGNLRTTLDAHYFGGNDGPACPVDALGHIRLLFDIGIGGLFSPEYIEEPWSFGRVLDLISHLWIAVFVLGTTGTAALIRVMRTILLDELNKPYVVTARAKGMPEWKLILKYPVRLALNSLVSTLGNLLPVLMSGSVIVSVVLRLPTEGPLLLRALLAEDLFVSAASVLFLGTLTVIGTLFSDILLGILDPRIRIGYPGIPRQPAIVTWSGYGRPDSQTLCAARPDVCRIA